VSRPILDPKSLIVHEFLPQLNALEREGLPRLLGVFANIDAESQLATERAFTRYSQIPGEGDLSMVAEDALADGIEYHRMLSDLKQALTNLLAAGLHHLHEQHIGKLRESATKHGLSLPELSSFQSAPQINELRLLANAVKHAHGSSAAQLRVLRPEYFVPPLIRGSVLGDMVSRSQNTIRNPLGGTDLFPTALDITTYCAALRAFWDELLSRL
jgi:hypothetical protein